MKRKHILILAALLQLVVLSAAVAAGILRDPVQLVIVGLGFALLSVVVGAKADAFVKILGAAAIAVVVGGCFAASAFPAQVSKALDQINNKLRIIDDQPLCLGSGDDACLTYDEAGDDRAEATGSWAFTTESPVLMAGGWQVPDDNAAGFGDDADWTFSYDEAATDNLLVTASSAASYVRVIDGNLAIGNGTPTNAANGEDLYVEGNSEFDGSIRLDGGLTSYAAVTLAKVVADPCPGGYPEGAVFYNDTADILCLCDGAGADLKISDGSACF